MSKNDGDSSENKSGSLFSKLFRWNDDRPKEEASGVQDDWKEAEKLPSSDVRSLPNVRERISNLLALKNSGRQSYNETELKQYWMPDSVSKECYACEEKFTTFRRRHHCRVCGQIFCSNCCNKEIPGKIVNCTGSLRVCNWCGKRVLSEFQSTVVGSEIPSELKQIINDLEDKFGDCDLRNDDDASQSRSSVTPDREQNRKTSVGYQEERFGNRKPEPEVRNTRCLLDEALTSPLFCTSHRYRLRTYYSTFPASKLIEWLISNHKAANREQAISLGQGFLDSEYIECVNADTNIFGDNQLLYRAVPEKTVQDYRDLSADSDSDFVERSSESSCNDNGELNVSDQKGFDEMKVTESCVSDDTKKAAEEVTSQVKNARPSVDWNSVDTSLLSDMEKEALENLKQTFVTHCSSYLRQILNSESIPQSWAKTICPLTCSVVRNIQPEKSKAWSEAMDIRHYIHIKKVSGGERKESEIIQGLAFTKNLTHRAMPKKMVDPRILILTSPIMFQRVEGKYLSLEPVIMQEHDYVQRTVSKIVDLGPNIVVVGKSVTRLAQELLHSKGISLVINVKRSLLERLSRLTGADILTSVDPHTGKTNLGTCQLFSLRTFTTETNRKKTLMVFEGCPYPELGCTILLRGGSVQELTRVKRASKSLIFAYYNARLEVSYHMDAGAVLPSGPKAFLDSLDEVDPTDENCFCAKSKLKVSVHQEEKKTEAVSDFSDPLRAEDISTDVSDGLSVEEIPFKNNFRKALEDNILSISPFLKFSLPYLESEQGKNCALRSFFSKELYWSPQFADNVQKQKSNSSVEYTRKSIENVKLKEVHKFVEAKLVKSADSLEVRKMLANYRATGGRLPISNRPFQTHYYNQLLLNNVNVKNRKDGKPIDVLDPENHQRLLTLFCSYSFNRKSPTFCVDPAIVNMEMYGRMDIPLELFLDKYCFRDQYTCKMCDFPIRFHTRRFVHNGGAVQITLFPLEKELPYSSKIYMWTYCAKCSLATNIRCMSPGSRCFSFGKYLELRFYGGMYHLNKSECQHSLYQDHVHHFAKGSILVSLSYSKVSIWEISLPSKELKMEAESLKFEEIKVWSLMGNQIFSDCLNKICSFNISESVATSLKQQLQKDQAVFKSRLEDAQEKISEDEMTIQQIWSLEDSLVLIKRHLAECVVEWNLRLNEAEAFAKKEDKRKSLEVKSQNILSDHIINGEKVIENDDVMQTSTASVGEEIHEDEVRNDGNESAADTDDGDGYHIFETKPVQDKKSVKTILSQLLPNSNQNNHIQMPFNNTEHHLLPIGVMMPLVVYEKEPSSIIAYALNSHQYNQAMEKLKTQMSSPSSKRKSGTELTKDEIANEKRNSVLSYLRSSSSGSMDKTKIEGVQYNPNVEFEEEPKEEKKSQKTETQDIDIQFNDGTASFKVKIYHAEDFARLRAAVLPEGDEGFIRSLSRCVVWAASGGKSGSNFNKTKDDRFILKAMTRIEMQLFLESASNYFNYINCVTSGMPTLLGKILGVYRISVKSDKTNTTCKVLVMEHLFYNRAIKHKFDLKGSERNRLTEASNDHSETTLQDENLIRMAKEDPLYILSHSKTVLMRAIQNDTEFLASLSVMDYSLLVGLDETKKELVVGIIDYIRGYTWDKRIESIIKTIGQTKMPTIIPADEYRERFIAAMHRYFLPVPDRWTGLGHEVDSLENEIKQVK